jgi:transposase-like protein
MLIISLFSLSLQVGSICRLRSGKQQYHCKDCGAYRIFESEKKYNETRKGEIIRTYFERASLRGLERIFHVSRQTVSEWLKKNNRKSSLN